MSLQNTRTQGFRPPWFLPTWQQGDHRVLVDHTSSAISTVAISTINIEKGTSALLVQAIGANIRYVLVGTPSATSGFRLTVGADPIAIPVVEGMSVQFIAEAAGAFLEMQAGRLN